MSQKHSYYTRYRKRLIPHNQNQKCGFKDARSEHEPIISQAMMRVAYARFWSKRGLPVPPGFAGGISI